MSNFGRCITDPRLTVRMEESGSPCGRPHRTRAKRRHDIAKLNDHSTGMVSMADQRAQKNLPFLSCDETTPSSTVMNDSPDSGISLGGEVTPLHHDSEHENAAARIPNIKPSFTMDDDSLDGFITSNLDFEENDDVPQGLRSLIHAPLIPANPDSSSDEMYRIRRPAFQRLSRRFDSLNIRPKRPSPARQEGESPELKKRREIRPANRSYSLELPVTCKNTIKRCQSANDAIIKEALDRVYSNPSLISDGSKPYCLPTIPGKHQDLTSITPETLTRVINNEFSDIISQYVIVDCRYPFEYNGGHIMGAMNYFTKESIMENLLSKPLTSKDSEKRTILIFHCEFSSERAPKLSRFLRSMDRDQNKDCYPELHYPELYLLDGGYKNFYETNKEMCVPESYVPMLHADYKDDLRTFRAKWKSWPGEKKKSRFTLF